MPDPCTYVTERATEGMCRGIIPAGDPADGRLYGLLSCGVGRAAHETEGAHAYLGPVLARCGHEEGEHVDFETWLFGLDGIYGEDAGWHEFTRGD